MQPIRSYIQIAKDLEDAGLFWQPEIGDEILERKTQDTISILVDPLGMTPTTLRATYMWLPTVEQLMLQFEARQAVLFHAGLELTERAYYYKTVIQSPARHIESKAESLRNSLGLALRDLLVGQSVH